MTSAHKTGVLFMSEKVGRLLQLYFSSFFYWKREMNVMDNNLFSGFCKCAVHSPSCFSFPFFKLLLFFFFLLFTFSPTDRFEMFTRPSSSVCVFVKTFAAHHTWLPFFWGEISDICIHHPLPPAVKPEGDTLWLLRQRWTNHDDVAERKVLRSSKINSFDPFHPRRINKEPLEEE